MISPTEHRAFADLVERARVFVLVTHLNPDGDAIGSQVGLGRYLQSIGREVRLINQDATPKELAFLEFDGPAGEAYDPARHDGFLDAADAIVLVDNSAPDRLGRMEAPALARVAKTFCIDHHPSRETPWAENVIDTTAAATALLVYELLRAREYTPDRAAADALYSGLATDTGFFRFNSTSPRALRVAADLLELGADPTRCYREVFERNSPAYTRLLGRALAGLSLSDDGRVGSVAVTLAMVEACGAAGVDTSEVTTPVLAVDGVRLAILFRELPEGKVKVSLRSKGAIDVQQLAAEFGGGGHRNASGIVLPGRFDDVVKTLTARAASLAAAAL
ncbi:MAG TPA: bifunctional oligoribonuclease/PAP phosphatase NrnA [Candidatus Polarisedimenticolaceae bacterium]|nr:bifunctional oligoribonuclease/PAP phosphatase NrnA [Candidatus Polarisedimenticolaceae bacterium]